MTIHLLIRGKVQGVYFRASAKEKAEQLGLSGWVRNTSQGDVEAVVSGDQEIVDAFVVWCRQGPPTAKVSSVDVKTIGEEITAGFAIRK